MSSNKKLAEQILKNVGGKENISNFLHCATRLRFNLIDFDKVNKVRGMDVVIVTTAKTNEEAKALLEELGMPFPK